MEFEQLIALYLTRGGKIFIAPSYSIPGANSEEEWACPDFVALDFEKHEVVVVEGPLPPIYTVLLARSETARSSGVRHVTPSFRMME